MSSRTDSLRKAFSNLGVINVASYIVKTKILNKVYRRAGKSETSVRTGTLNVRQLTKPLLFRYNSSDISVFWQVFVRAQLRVLTMSPQNVKFILDCGANVGYTTAYFLAKFPNAHVVAIEPDKRNYELLKQNVAPYGNRVTTLCSAVWSHPTSLKVCAGQYLDKREWATIVRECEEGEEADTEAFDIDSLLRRFNQGKIDILKMDIEGSEAVVFGSNYEGWIDKVDTFAVELHGRQCKEVFYNALNGRTFNFSRAGELTVARRSEPT